MITSVFHGANNSSFFELVGVTHSFGFRAYPCVSVCVWCVCLSVGEARRVRALA